MPADLSTPLSLVQLFDASPDQVFWLQAVRTTTDAVEDLAREELKPTGGAIVDLIVRYVNPKVADIDPESGQMGIGFSARNDWRTNPAFTEKTFRELCQVVETEKAMQAEFFQPMLQQWVRVTYSKAGDGILAIARAMTTPNELAAKLEQQRQLPDRVFNPSPGTIFVYQAIRDAQQELRDFELVLVNKQGRDETLNYTRNDIEPKTLLTINPSSWETGQFNVFKQVIDTGKPVQLDQFYAFANGWFRTTITRLNDGVVVMATNSTDQKLIAPDTELQRTLPEEILNTTQQVILVLKALRDTSGAIFDFQITHANAASVPLLRHSVETLLQHTLLTLFPGTWPEGLFRIYQTVVHTGESYRGEHYYKQDGLNTWFEVSAVKYGDGLLLTLSNLTKARAHLAEQALVASAANLQAVIDVSQTGIFVLSPVVGQDGELIDFRFKTINRVVASLVKQTPDVLTGSLVSAWFTQYYEWGLFDRYRYTFETGEKKRFELNYTADGFNIWYDVKVIRFGENLLVTFTDYTSLKQTQQKLEKTALDAGRQADLLNRVLDNSDSGVIAFEAVRDDTGTIVDFIFLVANKRSAEILGKSQPEMMGNKLLTIFPGSTDSGLFTMYCQATETGEPGYLEIHYNDDGLDVWLDLSAQKLGDGFVITFTDRTASKQAALLIEKSAAELRTVIDSAQVAIFLITPVVNDSSRIIDFRFRTANQMIARYVGQEPEALAGELVSSYFSEYLTNGLFERYYETYRTGASQRFDFHYVGGGIDAWLDIMTTKSNDDVLVTFGDYTPLKRLQQELENSVAELQRSNKNLEQFAYIASHDLQEPLRKIQAFGDIIHAQFSSIIGHEGSDMIGRMQSAAARMQVLINDVLAYSRVATKRETVGPVNLNQVVADVLIDLETAVAEKKAVLSVEPLPTVRGDAAQLRQLFQNLFSNALKFSQLYEPAKPPMIWVKTRRAYGRELTVSSLLPADSNRLFHLIQVVDNGIGFDPKQAERIFEVFQRLHGRSEYQGTGIGLAIVQKVVENHQGHILAEGKPGAGATFTLLLPV